MSDRRGEFMSNALVKFGLVLAVAAFIAGPLPLAVSCALAEEVNEELDKRAGEFKDQVAAADLQLLITGAQGLAQAVQTRDLAATRKAWLETHAIWMRCEAFTADLFPGLETKINATDNPKTGFHVIEKSLFAPQPTVNMAIVQQLIDDLQIYQHVFGQAKWTGYYLLASSSTYTFEMGDIAGDGGESPVSGSSIADLQHGLDGVERVWKFMFADPVRAKDHFKAEEIDDQIAALHGLLGVSALDQIPEGIFTRETTRLAAEIADLGPMFGWRKPNYTDIGE
ncbi:MAG TPA: imelysin family protein [Candidatus Polarisedimenticolia bacterium]|nr:imelysin family protein [Candidatus Polarisedimenticolia bacterium]